MRSSLIEPRTAPTVDPYRVQSTPVFQRPQTPPPAPAPTSRQVVLAPNEGWLPLVLLAIAVYSVVYSVTAAITITHTTVLWVMTAIGLLCGLAVSKIRPLPQSLLHLCTCIVGFWLALFLTSSLAAHISPLILLAELRAVVAGGFTLANAPNSDVVFLFYLSFLCFFLGYFGSWLIYRAHLPWLVALVYISIMVVNLNYVVKRDLSFLIVILVGSLLLLIARIQLASQVTQWKNDGLYTDHTWLNGMAGRFLRIATLFMLLVLPLSWFLPVLNQPSSGVSLWNNLDNAWSHLTHGHLSALGNPSTLFSPYQPPADFFGDQLTITGSVNLPTGPVLSYTSSAPTQGQYLQAFTFDQFDGHTWTALVSNSNQVYPSNSSLPLDLPSANYNSLKTSVTILQPPGGTKNYIFAPLQPYSFTVPITLVSDNTGSFTSAWTKSSPLAPHEQYEVTSEVPAASPADLSAIPLPGDNSGAWDNDNNYSALQQHYLQVPGNLSQEVVATARTWTHGAQNTYEAVLDLQKHLSDPTAFKYSLDNSAVPANIDAVTWLLHTHQGYCTYYSTAMVVMARLLQFPARIVNGFSQGNYDAQQKIWMVNGNDAHSWVQVYFPDYGWINFDPTPGFAIPSQTSASATPAPSPTTAPVSSSPTTTPHVQPTRTHSIDPTQLSSTPPPTENIMPQNLLLTFALLFLLVSLITLGLAIVRYRQSHSPRSTITAFYARLCQLAGLVGAPPKAWQTPYEYTFALSKRFPEAAAALRQLADLFVRERWASPQHAPAPAEQRALTMLWPRLRNAILRSPFGKGR